MNITIELDGNKYAGVLALVDETPVAPAVETPAPVEPVAPADNGETQTTDQPAGN